MPIITNKSIASKKTIIQYKNEKLVKNCLNYESKQEHFRY